MWIYLAVVAVAILLATVSPLLAAVDAGLLLRTWFQWLPVEVYLMLLPDTEVFMAALAILVIAVPYLLIFLLVWPVPPALRRILKPGNGGLPSAQKPATSSARTRRSRHSHADRTAVPCR